MISQLIQEEFFQDANLHGTVLAMVCATWCGMCELDRASEVRVVQLDFSAAFDRVNHYGLIYKLKSVGSAALC